VCWSNLFGWMSDLKMLEANQTGEIHKKVLNYLAWSQSALLYIKNNGKM
jgi:hypothetical protein